jgi:exodeoxyribonuclease V alpha subunit
MTYIQGTVKAIIFHSEENSYTIIKIKITEMTEKTNLFVLDDSDYVTVTGYFPVPMRGEEIRFYGEFQEHSRYGLQYQVKSYEKLTDTSIPGLIEYLSSDLFHGVGIKTAEKIVKALGKETITTILDNKDSLNQISGLSDKQKDVIYDGLIENKAAENTLIQLYAYGITPKMAIKIYKYYQTDTIAIIEQNPYQLIYDIEGIGFERADIIARNIGFAEDHPLRIKAMIMYLYQLMGINYGHTFLYYEQLLEYLISALNKKETLVSEDTVIQYLAELITEDVLERQDDVIKLKSVSYAEQMVTKRIKEAAKEPPKSFDDKQIEEHITMFEQLHEIQYTPLQKKAIKRAMESNVFILTGGPGTGKTTVIKGLVYVYAKYHELPILYDNPLFEVKLIAPTGRAAKRMKEATGYHAETIHRFLGYGFDGKFLHNRDNQVEAEVIIVDEASMIDIFLASQLFQSIPTSTKIIIVGDEDQLPSVGPGQVLKDLIDTDVIDTVRLNTIHRQAEDSHIIDLAYQVNQGLIPPDIKTVYEDRLFVEETAEHFHKRLLSSIHYVINQGYDLWKDVQILIPMYRGITGIDTINKLIQDEFNPAKRRTIEHGDREFRHGDKVIQLSNQIEDGIMNGDQGIVIGITEEDILVVDFDGTEVTYKKGDLIHLKHAYAMSIHKAQGSEYGVVIMPLFRSYSIMLKRKLLYTGITRAKEKLIMMGDLAAFEYGVTRIEDIRQSTLKDDIVAAVLTQDDEKETIQEQPKDVHYINDESIPFDTLGEELNGKSPYDFMEVE